MKQYKITGEILKMRAVTKVVQLIECDHCKKKIENNELYISITGDFESKSWLQIDADVCKSCINNYISGLFDDVLEGECEDRNLPSVLIKFCKADYNSEKLDSMDLVNDYYEN